MIEWFGRMFFPRSGGVWIIEAEKQIYAAVGIRTGAPAARAWQGMPASI